MVWPDCSSTTGWPRAWLAKGVTSEAEFLQSVRFFSDIDRAHWGKLLTPLVNGIRVAGPFAPSWAEDLDHPHFVLIDTEGLGHKANTVPDVPDYIVSRFDECDAILLVHKGDVPGYEGGKALEAIAGAGHTAKTSLVFTRMDEVKGPNIKGWQAKRDYAFSGVRNVVENQIAKTLTPDIARFMLEQLERSPYYLGALQKGDKAQPDWQVAYAFRGTGSTFDRRLKIESLYERWVPEPANEADDMRHVQEFVEEMKRVVTSAIDETKKAMVTEADAAAVKAA